MTFSSPRMDCKPFLPFLASVCSFCSSDPNHMPTTHTQASSLLHYSYFSTTSPFRGHNRATFLLPPFGSPSFWERAIGNGHVGFWVPFYSYITQVLCKLLFLLAACLTLVSHFAYSSTLKMNATHSSKTSFDFHWTTGHYILDDRRLHNHLYENLKSYIWWWTWHIPPKHLTFSGLHGVIF
jgi:hypothetical protein